MTKTTTRATNTNRTDSKAVAKTDTSARALEALQNIEQYLDATAEESAQFLKFVKGEFQYGVDEETLDAGTELALKPDSIEAGHVRFFDNKVTDEAMTPVCNGMFTPRDQLGDDDEALWETDDDGKPSDPWRRCRRFQCKSLETGEEFIFSTFSQGGRRAVDKMLRGYHTGLRKKLTGIPIICNDVDDYKHPKYGKVFVPQFPIIAWKSEAELMGGEPDLDAELNDSIPI
jgi:hypothetical protein